MAASSGLAPNRRPCLCSLGSRCDRVSPGCNLGTGIFQDKSVEVWRDVRAFVEKHLVVGQPRVFVARLGLRPCFVVASHRHVEQFLGHRDNGDHFYNGLKDFFFGLFGPSILFAADRREAEHLRQMLVPLFQFASPSLGDFDAYLNQTLNVWSRRQMADSPKSVVLYHKFKHLSLSFNLRLFLGVDEAATPDLFQNIAQMTTAHWHGIISVPLNVKLSFMSSSYRRAVDAKDKLLALIDERLRSGQLPFLQQFSESGMDHELVKNHLLVFVCALIPKATASILTSIVDTAHLWYEDCVEQRDDGTVDVDQDRLELVLLEVLRLWPPLVGGLRVANRDADLGQDYHVPKGYGVFYVSMMAHRDPEVFPRPDEFLPERWNTFNANDRDRLFAFGGNGPHSCVGQLFMRRLIEEMATYFIKTYEWDYNSSVEGPEERIVKYLPVSRPAALKATRITARLKTPAT